MLAKNQWPRLTRSRFDHRTWLATGAAAMLLAGQSFAAQAAAATPAATANDGADTAVLQEITVTAQKREQKLQEVPIAVSVISGAQIEALGGFNIEQMKTLVSSLNIRKTNTPLNQALFLRGVGTINFAISAQPSVAFVLDGVVLSAAGEAFGDFYDVDRIEVLRGPQGTLFGKNSSAGVVNVVSKRPGKTYGGYVDVGWYEQNELKIKAAFDTPLSDTLRGRTTATYGDFPGFIKNVTTGPAHGKTNGYDRKGIRTLWVADVSDKTQLTFIGDYRKSDDPCCAELIGTAPTGAQAIALTNLLSGTTFSGADTRTIRQNLVTRSQEEAYGASVQADFEINQNTLTSITAYRKWNSTEIREGDWLDAGGAPYVGIGQLHDYGPQKQHTFSEELRITSPSGGFLEYVGGLYYSTTNAERFFQRSDIVCTASTLAPDSTGLRPCTAAASTIVTPTASADFGADFKNFAVYGDGTFHVSDAFRIITGLRWTQDKLSFFHNYNPSPIAGPGLRTVTSGFTGSNSSDNVSGRGGLQWDINKNLMTYATYARGYKGPAYNVFFNMTPNDQQVIAAETADSVELGLKSTLFGGRMVFNAAAFSAKYKNFQANNFLVLNGVTITTLTNAGDVTTGGVEFDFSAKPVRNLSLNGSMSYTDARIDSVFTPAGQTPRYKVGTQLALAPKWKGTLSADYRMHLASMDVIPGLNWSAQSEQFSDLNEPAALRIPGYGTVDATLAFADKDDRYRVTLVGRNLGAKSYAALLTPGGPGGAVRYQVPRDADRYFGIQARYNFAKR